jgi:cytochrome c
MNKNLNTAFAGLIIAGLVAMTSGFIAKAVINPTELKEPAVKIDTASVSAVPTAGADAPKVAEPIADLMATADIAAGEKLSKACVACHSFEKGGPNKVGPNMWNVVNGPKAHIAGYAYSKALLEKGGTWSVDSLNQFLWSPKTYIPGTKMGYAGMKKPQDRANLIKWMETLK